MMPSNNFEENLRRQFQGAKMPPSPNLWEKVSTKLDQLEEKPKARLIPLWVWGMAVAAGLALLFCLPYLRTTDSVSGQQMQAQSETQEPVSSPAASEQQSIATTQSPTPDVQTSTSISAQKSTPEQLQDAAKSKETAAHTKQQQVSKNQIQTPIFASIQDDTQAQFLKQTTVKKAFGIQPIQLSKTNHNSLITNTLTSINPLIKKAKIKTPRSDWDAILINPEYNKMARVHSKDFNFEVAANYRHGFSQNLILTAPNPAYQAYGTAFASDPTEVSSYEQVFVAGLKLPNKSAGIRTRGKWSLGKRIDIESGLDLALQFVSSYTNSSSTAPNLQEKRSNSSRSAYIAPSVYFPQEPDLAVRTSSDPILTESLNRELAYINLNIPLLLNYYIKKGNSSLVLSTGLAYSRTLAQFKEKLKTYEYNATASNAINALNISNDYSASIDVLDRVDFIFNPHYERKIGKSLAFYMGPTFKYSTRSQYKLNSAQGNRSYSKPFTTSIELGIKVGV